MKRPLIYAAVFLAAGIYSQKYEMRFIPMLAAVIMISISLYKINNDKLSLVMPVVYMTGIIAMQQLEYAEYNIKIEFMERMRKSITDVYYKYLPEKEAGTVSAFITGDKSGLKADIKSLYKGAGVYHILAISGLHIGIITAGLVKITDMADKKYARLAVVAFIALYAVFTGGSPSTVRAVIMASVMIFSRIFERDGDFLSSVAFAAVVILLFKPSDLFDIGFQYSFCAVTTIGIFSEKLEKICGDRKALCYILNCFIICLSMKMISVFYFEEATLGDFLTNLIFIPLMGILVILSGLGGIVGVLFGDACKIMLAMVFYILKLYEFICTIISENDFMILEIKNVDLMEAALFYLCIIAAGYTINGHYGFERERVKYFAASTVIFAGYIFLKETVLK